eukprot:1141385-Pelagomonas_calceolata.AAC.4
MDEKHEVEDQHQKAHLLRLFEARVARHTWAEPNWECVNPRETNFYLKRNQHTFCHLTPVSLMRWKFHQCKVFPFFNRCKLASKLLLKFNCKCQAPASLLALEHTILVLGAQLTTCSHWFCPQILSSKESSSIISFPFPKWKEN